MPAEVRIFDSHGGEFDLDGHKATFTEIKPVQFRRLRAASHVADDAYLASMYAGQCCARLSSGPRNRGLDFLAR